MCGICLALRVPIDNHLFNFDFFEQYGSANEKHLPLNQHIKQNKLELREQFVPLHLLRELRKRGPDQLTVSEIQLYKTTFQSRQLSKQQETEGLGIPEGTALAFQSTLHLRGDKVYQPTTPGSFMLYNGEIWSTGHLEPIESHKGQNDAEWLHKQLISCHGNEEKIIQLLRSIRGDFAIILVEGDKVMVMKDFFGKRSLLVAMSGSNLILSSVPVEAVEKLPEPQDQAPNGPEEDGEVGWKQKYEAEWLSSKNKNFFEVPSNSLISITIRNSDALWEYYPIQEPNLLRSIEKVSNCAEEQIISTCKKYLVESVLELTRSVKGLGEGEGPAKVAVLFSGGVDSTLIARILDLVLPKDEVIDLVNLAFREDAPDRETGKASYEELKSLSPHRSYNLIQVDKTLNDIEPLKKHLTQVIYPKTTHMDFNIATALHVASRETKARIILTGLGADEVFSGYSRYRIAFKRGGFPEAESEMVFDMERLWIRNLGRDDRAISMNAKEVRYPFLYLPLWQYLRSLELGRITQGTGEKQMLRYVAKQFGLNKASTFKKKAIQFGTRLAKLSNVKSFGSNRKAKGVYQYTEQ